MRRTVALSIRLFQSYMVATTRPGSIQQTFLAAERSLSLPCRAPVPRHVRQQLPAVVPRVAAVQQPASSPAPSAASGNGTTPAVASGTGIIAASSSSHAHTNGVSSSSDSSNSDWGAWSSDASSSAIESSAYNGNGNGTSHSRSNGAAAHNGNGNGSAGNGSRAALYGTSPSPAAAGSNGNGTSNGNGSPAATYGHGYGVAASSNSTATATHSNGNGAVSSSSSPAARTGNGTVAGNSAAATNGNGGNAPLVALWLGGSLTAGSGPAVLQQPVRHMSSSSSSSSSSSTLGAAPEGVSAAAATVVSSPSMPDCSLSHQQQQSLPVQGQFRPRRPSSSQLGPRAPKFPPSAGLNKIQAFKRSCTEVARGQAKQAFMKTVAPALLNSSNGNGSSSGGGSREPAVQQSQQRERWQPSAVSQGLQQQQEQHGWGVWQPQAEASTQPQQQQWQPSAPPLLPQQQQQQPPQQQAVQRGASSSSGSSSSSSPAPPLPWTPPATNQPATRNAGAAAANAAAASPPSAAADVATTAAGAAAAAEAGDTGEPPLDWSAIRSGPSGSLWALPGDPSFSSPPEDVCVVNSPESAQAVVDQLMVYAREGMAYTDPDTGVPHFIPPEEVYFACDTEVADIDVKSQSPVGHGTVICFSIYAGPWAHFSTTSSSGSRGVVAAAAVAAEAAAAGGDGAAAAGQQQRQQRQPVGRIWVDLTSGWQRRMEQEWEAAQQQAAAARQAQLQQQQQELSAAAGAAAAGRLGSTAAAAARRQVSGGTVDASGQLRTREELQGMSLKDLKAVGKELDLVGRSKYTAAQKSELIKVLLERQAQKQQPQTLQQQQQGLLQEREPVQELGQQQQLEQFSALQEPQAVQQLGQQQLGEVQQQQGGVQPLHALQHQDPQALLQEQQLAAAKASGSPEAEPQAAVRSRRRRSSSTLLQSRSASSCDPAASFAAEQQPLLSQQQPSSPPQQQQQQQQQHVLQGFPPNVAGKNKGALLAWMQQQYKGQPWLPLLNRYSTVVELHDLAAAAQAAAATGGPLVVPVSVQDGIVRRGSQSTRYVNTAMLVALLEFYRGVPYTGKAVTPAPLLEKVQKEYSRAAAAAAAAGSSGASRSVASGLDELTNVGIERGGGGPIAALAQLQPAAAEAVDSPNHSSSSNSSSSDYAASPDSTDSMPLRRRRSSSNTNSWGSPLPPPSSLAVHGVMGSVAALAPPSLSDLAADESAVGILREFQRFFCNGEAKKVWHNYGFDRHVMDGLLEGVLGSNSSSSGSADRTAVGSLQMQGFAGDTLHMSRLHDASRKTRGGYGLEALSSDKQLMRELTTQLRKQYGQGFVSRHFPEDDPALNVKRSMKERFGLRKVRADSSGLVKAPLLPPVHLLQLDEHFRNAWIDYSALDAKATWNVHYVLKHLLAQEDATMDVYLCQQLQTAGAPGMAAALRNARFAAKTARDKAEAVQQGQAMGIKSTGVVKAKPTRPPKMGRSQGSVKTQQAAAEEAATAAAAVQVGNGGSSSSSSYTMWDLYQMYWLPFGDVLSAMESAGVRVDRDFLAGQQVKAEADQQAAQQHFRTWASKYVKGAELMNVNSQTQIRQMLFPGECSEPVKSFKTENPQYDPNARPRPRRWIDYELHGIWGKEQPGRLQADVKTAKGTAAVSTAVLWSLVGKPGAAAKALAELNEAEAAASAADAGSSSSGDATHQQQEQPVSIFDDELSPHDLQDESDSTTAAALAGGDGGSAGGEDEAEVIRIVPGGDLSARQLEALQQEAAAKKLGKMYAAMGGGREGLEACVALEKLIEVSLIEKLLTAFILPLQHPNISTSHPWPPQGAPRGVDNTIIATSSSSSASSSVDGQDAPAEAAVDNSSSNSSSSSSALVLPTEVHRVHCSLNLNTETGRLSARRPNLQNQPAMEKDRYKVRRAFCAEPDKTLIVADYGQLELRLLAHMANCASMIQAFELGGDFHSRTALGMYDHIKEAIANGECLLEWDGGPDHKPPPAPLLKDKFGSERRKAKILNFSIAYGKTAHGLSKDWGVTLDEAEDTVKRWYADRPEVEQWQREQRAYAAEKGHVNTMVGRRRGLRPAINSSDRWMRARAERAAINTPIQGSAADVASAAMLSVVQDKVLKELDWKLLLQVHDEVMMEGPKGSAEAALQRVIACMENPWENLCGFVGRPLRVELAVDAKIADNWYEAK